MFKLLSKNLIFIVLYQLFCFMQKYQYLGPIGQGGFGKVYKVKQKQTGNIRVVKKIQLNTQNLLQQVKRQYKIISSFNHPNLIKGINCFQQTFSNMIPILNYFCIVMEYPTEKNLTSYLNQNKQRLTEDQIINIYKQARDALQYLHSMGFNHMDIKPQNILIDQKMEIKLIDLGASKENKTTKITQNIVTINYADPSTKRGQNKLTSKRDLFALGLVLLQLTLGEQFKQQNPEQKVKQIENIKSDRIKAILQPLLTLDRKSRKWYLFPQQQQLFEVSEMLYQKSIRFRLKGMNIEQSLKLVRFKDFNEIKKIYLQQNKIKDISIFAFMMLRHVSSIDLSNNLIQDLSVFKQDNLYTEKIKLKFNQLKQLFLNKNKITTLNSFTQAKLPVLNYLNLQSNQIKDANGLLKVNLKQLVHLNLQNNEIQDINFLKNPNFNTLQIINLSKNKISKIQVLKECHFVGIKKILLNFNLIYDIDVFQQSKQLIKCLQCTVQCKLCKFQFVESLQLYSNCLQFIPEVKGMKKLEEISVGKNLATNNRHGQFLDIRDFEFWSFQNLQSLDLKWNKLPSNINFQNFKLPKLKLLELQYNYLSDLDFLKGINFPNLINLYLFDNKITNILGLIHAKFPILENLYLGWNEIEDITPFLLEHHFQNIKIMDFRFNLIKNIPEIESIGIKAPKLQKLQLSQNIFFPRFMHQYKNRNPPLIFFKKC